MKLKPVLLQVRVGGALAKLARELAAKEGLSDAAFLRKLLLAATSVKPLPDINDIARRLAMCENALSILGVPPQ